MTREELQPGMLVLVPRLATPSGDTIARVDSQPGESDRSVVIRRWQPFQRRWGTPDRMALHQCRPVPPTDRRLKQVARAEGR